MGWRLIELAWCFGLVAAASVSWTWMVLLALAYPAFTFIGERYGAVRGRSPRRTTLASVWSAGNGHLELDGHHVRIAPNGCIPIEFPWTSIETIRWDDASLTFDCGEIVRRFDLSGASPAHVHGLGQELTERLARSRAATSSSGESERGRKQLEELLARQPE